MHMVGYTLRFVFDDGTPAANTQTENGLVVDFGNGHTISLCYAGVSGSGHAIRYASWVATPNNAFGDDFGHTEFYGYTHAGVDYYQALAKLSAQLAYTGRRALDTTTRASRTPFESWCVDHESVLTRLCTDMVRQHVEPEGSRPVDQR
jgi:hypothetical protein